MIFESPNWRVTRRMGVGDRQHVRSHLLSVGCFTSRHLLYTVEACYRAGVELGMMTRVHINAGREHQVVMEQLTRLVHRFTQHDAQLMEHGWMDHSHFTPIFESCDLIVEPKTEPNLNVDTYVDELIELVKSAWRDSGGRFLGGNFARHSDEELRSTFPNLWPDSMAAYQSFTHADPI